MVSVDAVATGLIQPRICIPLLLGDPMVFPLVADHGINRIGRLYLED